MTDDSKPMTVGTNKVFVFAVVGHWSPVIDMRFSVNGRLSSVIGERGLT
ncbi:MAG: hypothetical protein ACREJW_09970 [Candidatus Methylomirabilales bacterium]